MKVAFHQYKDLKRRFETPEKATKEFMAKHAPETFQGLYDKVESWAKEQIGKAEQKVETRLESSKPASRSKHIASE
jgi:hypothetical protein